MGKPKPEQVVKAHEYLLGEIGTMKTCSMQYGHTIYRSNEDIANEIEEAMTIKDETRRKLTVAGLVSNLTQHYNPDGLARGIHKGNVQIAERIINGYYATLSGVEPWKTVQDDEDKSRITFEGAGSKIKGKIGKALKALGIIPDV
jgi:hypothetical protein